MTQKRRTRLAIINGDIAWSQSGTYVISYTDGMSFIEIPHVGSGMFNGHIPVGEESPDLTSAQISLERRYDSCMGRS